MKRRQNRKYSQDLSRIAPRVPISTLCLRGLAIMQKRVEGEVDVRWQEDRCTEEREVGHF
jgi:hypothetical protein